MRFTLKQLPLLAALGAIVLAGAACAGQETPTAPPPAPTQAVVVFATESPPAATATRPPAATATLTPTVVAGMGATSNIPVQSLQDFEKYVAARPADVNPLTGLKVDAPQLLQHRPLMVRIGNDPVARPQTALQDADMVYEEITEWYITRFTAIYLSKAPAVVGPVRSARLINLPLTPQYQGALVSSGGSDGVRWELSQTSIVNLDEMFVPQIYFYRENADWQTRLAFDATAARAYLAEKRLDTGVNLRGFYFANPLDEKLLPTGVISAATKVVIPYPQVTSEATWKFDPASGAYLRFTVGEAHYDVSGRQISAANVIIYFADHQDTDIVEDSNGATSIRITMKGRGAAWLLRDGKLLKGNWQTDGNSTPLFGFDNGQPMPLKPGNTWVEVVPPEYAINIDGQKISSQPATPTPPAATATPAARPTLTPIGARPKSTPGN